MEADVAPLSQGPYWMPITPKGGPCCMPIHKPFSQTRSSLGGATRSHAAMQAWPSHEARGRSPERLYLHYTTLRREQVSGRSPFKQMGSLKAHGACVRMASDVLDQGMSDQAEALQSRTSAWPARSHQINRPSSAERLTDQPALSSLAGPSFRRWEAASRLVPQPVCGTSSAEPMRPSPGQCFGGARP